MLNITEQNLEAHLTELEQQADQNMAAVSLDTRIDQIYELSWASRNFNSQTPRTLLKIDQQIHRLLQTLDAGTFQSPELISAAYVLKDHIQEFLIDHPRDALVDPTIEIKNLENESKSVRYLVDPQKVKPKWQVLPMNERLAFLQKLHNRQAELLGIERSKVSYRFKTDITSDFIDGELEYGRGRTPYEDLFLNSRPDGRPRHSLRADIETVLLLGLRKFHLAALSKPKDFESTSSKHRNIIKLCSAEIAWRYAATHINEYEMALSLSHTQVGRLFVNRCFGGGFPLFTPLEPCPITNFFNVSERFCTIGTMDGYVRYFKGKFFKTGKKSLDKLSDETRRHIMIEYFRDAQDEFATRSSDQWFRFRSEISQVFRVLPLYPEFVRYYRDGRRAFVTMLKSNKRVQAVKHLWPFLPNWIRRGEVKYIAGLQDQAFANETFRPTAFCRFVFKPLNERTGGTHNTREICISTRFKENWDSFSWVLRVATHEKTHEQQFQMSLKYSIGELSDSSPLYRQAKQFKDFVAVETAERVYVQPEEDHSAYHNHPIERHARVIADAVAQNVGENGLGELVIKRFRRMRPWRQKLTRNKLG